MNRSLKKLLLKSQLLSIEEQDYAELDKKYAAEFSHDFREELASLKKEKKKEEGKSKSLVSNRTLKKMHRKLARATHPDINEEGLPFREVQEAYEKGDSGKMLSIAADLNVDISLTEKEMVALAKQLKSKRKKLEEMKTTVRWVWCTSDKSEELRSRICEILGVGDKTEKKQNK